MLQPTTPGTSPSPARPQAPVDPANTASRSSHACHAALRAESRHAGLAAVCDNITATCDVLIRDTFGCDMAEL